MFQSPAQVIRQIADLSYSNESVIYDKASFKAELKESFNDANSLRECLKNKKNFEDFQEALKVLIYGDNFIFVKYFYEKSFISQIAINTKRWEKRVLEGTAAKSGDSGKAYKSFQSAIKEVGYLSSETNQNLASQLTKNLNKAGKELWNFIKELDIIKSDKIIEKLIKPGQTEDEFLEVIGNIFGEYLLSASFTYGYNSKSGKKMQKKTTDGTLIDLLSKGLKGLSFYRANQNGKLKVVYPTATFLELSTEVDKSNGELEFQVFADKNTIANVVTGAIGFLQDLDILKDSDGNTLVEFIETSDNSFKMAFNNDPSLQNLDIDHMTQNQSLQAAEIVLDTIQNILSRYNDLNAYETFVKWRKTGVDKAFASLLYDDKHILDEILNKRTTAHVSGMIGETMFSLFLKLLSQQQGIGKKVQVLGQTDFGTGQAAVDTKIITDDLRDIGFQIKNYSSIKNTITLYSQSNKLSAEEEMKRYIENWAYKIIYDIFFTYNKDGNSVYRNDNYASLIAQVGNLLEYHIPYYLRFDEASLEKQEQDLTQNNFYILNFSFIPASVIFIIIAEALEENVEANSKKTNFFFFSKGKTKGDLFPQQNLLSSWENTFNSIRNDDAYKNNIVQGFINEVYINFIGTRITFQHQLNVLFENAK